MQNLRVVTLDGMPCNRLKIIIKKNYRPTGRRDRWRPLKRLLAVSNLYCSKGDPTACWLDGDDYKGDEVWCAVTDH